MAYLEWMKVQLKLNVLQYAKEDVSAAHTKLAEMMLAMVKGLEARLQAEQRGEPLYNYKAERMDDSLSDSKGGKGLSIEAADSASRLQSQKGSQPSGFTLNAE